MRTVRLEKASPVERLSRASLHPNGGCSKALERGHEIQEAILRGILLKELSDSGLLGVGQHLSDPRVKFPCIVEQTTSCVSALAYETHELHDAEGESVVARAALRSLRGLPSVRSCNSLSAGTGEMIEQRLQSAIVTTLVDRRPSSSPERSPSTSRQYRPRLGSLSPREFRAHDRRERLRIALVEARCTKRSVFRSIDVAFFLGNEFDLANSRSKKPRRRFARRSRNVSCGQGVVMTHRVAWTIVIPPYRER